MTATSITVDVHLTDDEWRATMMEDAVAGLTSSPKRLSPVWFYDGRGSELFDDITRLPEYYPTRAERSLLVAHSAEIAMLTAADTLVELGSGTSDKTRMLLDVMADREALACYVPFDVSEDTVRAAAGRLVDDYPGLDVHAVIGDFHRHLDAIPRTGRRLLAFLGGTIGNLLPDERQLFLRSLRRTMDEDDCFLLGFDEVKEPAVLVAAYDDAAGVTAEFNRNALRHLNQRCGGDFDPADFDHVARWNATDEWIEMHLESRRDHAVTLDDLDLTVHFERGERLRTEVSAKFRQDGIAAELRAAGLETERTWSADPGFGLLLARPISASRE